MSVCFGVEELTAYHVYLTVVRFLEGGGMSTLKLMQYYHLNAGIVNSWTISSLHDNMHEGKH